MPLSSSAKRRSLRYKQSNTSNVAERSASPKPASEVHISTPQQSQQQQQNQQQMQQQQAALKSSICSWQPKPATAANCSEHEKHFQHYWLIILSNCKTGSQPRPTTTTTTTTTTTQKANTNTTQHVFVQFKTLNYG
ncbi:protein hunchback-like [Bactrocera neohumeralis]|uniref:protein hunchback-like n=1 Tax=Bactrocera neohumeralis TaxID=98809 RepID=UPI002165ED25|nr:protein hunchback-like [Bactrocera neohumeralis]